MERKLLFITFLAILLTNLLGMAIKVEKVEASGTIYIWPDGSIDPETAPISTIDNVTYVFTDNIFEKIVVWRDNISVYGAGFTLQGPGTMGSRGIELAHVKNVTIKDMTITTFGLGIYLFDSSNNSLSENTLVNNEDSGISLLISPYNHICENNISDNQFGIKMERSTDNYIFGNILKNNPVCNIMIFDSPRNVVSKNIITDSANWGLAISGFKVPSVDNIISENAVMDNYLGFVLDDCSDNSFYHNNLINNTDHVLLMYLTSSPSNDWNNNCEGNYWSGYIDTNLDGDGIGDTPYIIDVNNTDSYPLMNPYWNPADINHDLKVDIFDVVLACVAYSSTPSDLNWNCHCDVAEPYGIINIFDIVMICSSYGEEYTS